MNAATRNLIYLAGNGVFSRGFRPFFLAGSVWAAIAMAAWIGILSGWFVLPSAFDPAAWHAHEFLFGYLGAVLAGFLLTAVPNWTGRPALTGWPLATLFGLWVLGRAVVAFSATMPSAIVVALDLQFPLALAVLVGREIVASRNWRNLIVIGLLGVLTLGNLLFHLEASSGDPAAQGQGLRIGVAAAVAMIALIGGRIVPSFTRNWMAARQMARLPAAPMLRFDRISLAVLLAALVAWVAAPEAPATAVMLLAAGLLHLLRLARWSGIRTGAEPMVLILHLGYAFIPLGALALGAEALAPGVVGMAAAQHLWMGGAIGVMTLAVMTRATLGHSGHSLTAGRGTVAIYAAIIGATLARVAAGAWASEAAALHNLSGLCWIAAFGGFAVLYGPLLLRVARKGDG